MILPKIPTREQALADFEPLTNVLYELMPELAQGIVAPYFTKRVKNEAGEDTSLPINRRLFSDMLRFELKTTLRKRGIPVEDDPAESEDDPPEVNGWDLENPANNGVAGTYRGYHFRIIKADGGDMPVPHSWRRIAEYGQQLSLFAEVTADGEVLPNILILWTFDSSYRVVQLQIACPKTGGRRRDEVTSHFCVTVPEPTTTVRREPRTQDEPKDLQITKRSDAVPSTENEAPKIAP